MKSCIMREGRRFAYLLGWGVGNLGDKGTRGGTLMAAAHRTG